MQMIKSSTKKIKINTKCFDSDEKYIIHLLKTNDDNLLIYAFLDKNPPITYKTKYPLDNLKKIKTIAADEHTTVNDIFFKLEKLIASKNKLQIFIMKTIQDQINLVIKFIISSTSTYDELNNNRLNILVLNLKKENKTLQNIAEVTTVEETSDDICFNNSKNEINAEINNNSCSSEQKIIKDNSLINKKRQRNKNEKKEKKNLKNIKSPLKNVIINEKNLENTKKISKKLNKTMASVCLENENEELIIKNENQLNKVNFKSTVVSPVKSIRSTRSTYRFRNSKKNLENTDLRKMLAVSKANEDNDLFNSRILTNFNEIKFLKETISKSQNANIMSITKLYDAENDGGESSIFHIKCDGNFEILIIIKTDKNIVFGGYTKKCFDSEKTTKKIDKNSFLFNLNKFEVYNALTEKNGVFSGIYNKIQCGPCFLNNAIITGKNILKDNGSVGKKFCGYNMKSDYEINFGDEIFKVQNMEVFKVEFGSPIIID